VADTERAAISLVCEAPGSINFILTASQAALTSTVNLCNGAPPRSAIEREIKEALRQRAREDTAIAWIRGHIGIPDNERADRLAAFTSILGEI